MIYFQGLERTQLKVSIVGQQEYTTFMLPDLYLNTVVGDCINIPSNGLYDINITAYSGDWLTFAALDHIHLSNDSCTGNDILRLK